MNPKIQHVIDEIDADRQQANTHWNISPEAGAFLHELIIARNAQTIVEIGTSIGYSALYLADAARETGGTIYTIESHAERFATAAENFRKANVTDIITQIKGHAPEVFTDFEPNPDFVFLDATKMEHISYIDALLPLLQYPACIVTDNILSHPEEMNDFIQYMHAIPGSSHELQDIGTGLLVSILTQQ